ncbi:putative UPF0598 protein C8orf82 [Trypanosoma theileri]|uniref:Putative UPF0598 protein C8orf82 n=1 Tax=Trypanosoma theileri TaxID=67003 RepID=A0A1X0NW80_9TRYP|nr:putative UPF0598 protein C8orf82 [Trypanosoma theileri]ORC88733.1 putative UPF0598 protein C8orf82 [Trypanosoma theileri]
MVAARRYYYYLNERGHLFHIFDVKGFVQSKQKPAGPAYLRDGVFLDFFYQRLQRNSLTHITACNNNNNNNNKMSGGISESIIVEDNLVMTVDQFLQFFPYVSLCGKEKNFLSVQDAPVVFTDYNFNSELKEKKEKEKDLDSVATLSFAGSLQEPFQPSALTVTQAGKLFHPITTLKYLHRTTAEQPSESVKGLVGAQVGLKLGFDFLCEEQNRDGQYMIEWNGQKYVIPYSSDQ